MIPHFWANRSHYLGWLPSSAALRVFTTFLSGSNTLTRPPDKAHSSRPHGEAHNSRSTWGTYSTRRDYPIIRMVAAIFLAILRMGDLLIQKAVFLKGMQCFPQEAMQGNTTKEIKDDGWFLL